MRVAVGTALLLLTACGPRIPEGDGRAVYQEALHRLSRNVPPAEVLPLLDAAVEREPGDARIYLARAGVLRLLGRPDDALADYAAALSHTRIPAERAAILLQRGLLHAEAERLDVAESDFAAALEAVPEYVEVYLQRSHFRRKAGRAEEADQDAAEARRLGAKLAQTFYNEGVRELNLGNHELALRYLRFTLQLDPASFAAHVGLARIAMQRRDFEEAEREMTLAIEKRPGEAALFFHRGNARRARSRFTEAIDDYTRAVALSPEFAAAYAARGSVYLRVSRDYVLAEQDFARALAHDPRSYQGFLGFGMLYHELTLLNHAEQSLRSALQIQATPEAAHALGRVLHDKGRFDQATHLYREALRICRDDVVRRTIEADLARSEAARDEENDK